jgi:two-component system nitrogen regulation sensor histidine kinase NtrY
LKDASDFREGQRGAWMRMRFAISGTPAKSEGSEPAPAAEESVKDPETKEPTAETKEPTEKTNDSTKIEASTGS